MSIKSIRNLVDKKIGRTIRRILFSHNKVKRNKLFVMTYDRKFVDNPRFIVEELLKRDIPIDIVWVGERKNKNRDEFPKQIRVVPYASVKMFLEQATAAVWLDNSLNCVWFDMPKKKNQIYINTWHGSMGIKKLGGNAEWMERAALCDKKTDYCITNSTFEEEVFRNTFWKSVDFLKYGHARNDILQNHERWDIIRKKVESELGVPGDSKILLYAPTFRDDGDLSWFDVDYDNVISALKNRFGGNWIILLRFHFKNRVDEIRGNITCRGVIDASDYEDMQELMVAADVGMTDYSSWVYDYVLTEKPVFIYGKDIEKYNTTRGFYYKLESTPFPIARNNSELVEVINSFDEIQYADSVEAFIKEKGCYERGCAAKLSADKICEIMHIN